MAAQGDRHRLLTGTLVTVVASLSPALRATRVPPILALREGAVLAAAAAAAACARRSPAGSP